MEIYFAKKHGVKKKNAHRDYSKLKVSIYFH